MGARRHAMQESMPFGAHTMRFNREIPHGLIRNTSLYRTIAVDAGSPLAHDPLVILTRAGVSCDAYYARTDGLNPPYRRRIPGATAVLRSRREVARRLKRGQHEFEASGPGAARPRRPSIARVPARALEVFPQSGDAAPPQRKRRSEGAIRSSLLFGSSSFQRDGFDDLARSSNRGVRGPDAPPVRRRS